MESDGKGVNYMSNWDDDIKAFWSGGNGCECIAWKGSHQVYIYPTWEHPAPPSGMIQHTKRIETLADFNEALEGKIIKVEYELTDQEREDFKNNNTERKVLINHYENQQKETEWFFINEVKKRNKKIKVLERIMGAGIAGVMIVSYLFFF